jgi:hypothetical protein
MAIPFEIEADDSDSSDQDVPGADSPDQAVVTPPDHEAKNQIAVSIVNNPAIGPVTSQLQHEPYLYVSMMSLPV